MIELRYKCTCFAEERPLMVRERAPAENVIDWMEAVVKPQLTEDHHRRSPLCQANAVEHLKIPVDDDMPIGNRMKQ